MPKYILPSWASNPDLNRLLFFYQLLMEMLDPETIDSYKAPVLTTASLCNEYLRVCRDIEHHFLFSQGLPPIKEELLSSLENDYIVKKILGNRRSTIIHKIKKSKDSREEMDSVKLLYNLIIHEYLNTIKSELTISITNPDGKKSVINALTRALISELVSRGYSSEYIQKVTIDFFRENDITSPEKITEFFEIFSFNQKKYNVIYKGAAIFEEFASFHLDLLDIQIVKEVDEIDDIKDKYSTFFEPSEKFPLYLHFLNIEGFEPYKAKDSSNFFLSMIFEPMSNIRHETMMIIEKDGLMPDCIVYSKGDEGTESEIVPITNNPILRIKECEDEKVLTEFTKALSASIKVIDDSKYILKNSMSLHNIAINTKSRENQLFNLWASLEAITPPPKENQPIINNFCEVIVPILCRDYNKKIFRYFVEFVGSIASEQQIEELLSVLPQDQNLNDLYKWALIISDKQYDDDLQRFCNKIGPNPLLCYRIWQLQEKYQTASGIKATIDEHKKRIDWQLRRIYRTRNLVAHKGRGSNYQDPLVENAHSYYHEIIDLIIYTSEKHNYKITSVYEIIYLIILKTDAYLYSLQQAGKAPLNIDNFRQHIFGKPMFPT